MKKRCLFIAIALTMFPCLFAQKLKGQILPLNEKANEEIVIYNTAAKDAFKIYVHTTDASDVESLEYSEDGTELEDGWVFLVKSPDIKRKKEWMSNSDYEILEHVDYICIESRSGNKYNYYFETRHDKLYITVYKYNEKTDSDSEW